MKVICVTGNYGDAVTNLKWYLLPDSAIVRTDNPVFLPDFDSEFRAYPSLAVRIDKLGKGISPKFAPRYYAEATIGVAMRAETQWEDNCKEGFPWSDAVSFDKSCWIGDFIAYNVFEEVNPLIQCGDERYDYDVMKIKKNLNEVIAKISRYHTLKTGDIVMCALTDTGIPLKKGDRFSIDLADDNLLTIRIK